MGFTFLVWNVEKFKATNTTRIRTVADHIKDQNPDVLCILEFMGKSSALNPSQKKDAARRLISEFLPKYDFGLTDSKKRIEILTGWKRDKFGQVLYTQRREFDVQNPNLRPGGLLSLRENGATSFHNFLFLHTDSGRTKRDYDNRQAMFKKIWKLKKALQGIPIQAGEARFLALGDLNTMGRSAVGAQPSISGTKEIAQLQQDAVANGMRILSKSFNKTWSNASGTTKSDLDHVIASDDLAFAEWTLVGAPSTEFEVEVKGWNERSGNARRSFIENISDHCSLWGEII
jgi:hypothetical protein